MYISVTAMLLYRNITSTIHYQLVLLRARLEIVVITVLLLLYTHRVLGYILGVYLRRKLDGDRTGKFAFYFDWIALRCGLDSNSIVFHGVTWRNPVLFKNTPYLLRIDEISIVVDIMSIYTAVRYNTSIRIKEIRFSKVTLYIEKLSERAVLEAGTQERIKKDGADVTAPSALGVYIYVIQEYSLYCLK